MQITISLIKADIVPIGGHVYLSRRLSAIMRTQIIEHGKETVN